MIKFRLGTLLQKLFYRVQKVRWEDLIIMDPNIRRKFIIIRTPEFEKDLESHLPMYNN